MNKPKNSVTQTELIERIKQLVAECDAFDYNQHQFELSLRLLNKRIKAYQQQEQKRRDAVI